MTTPTVGAMFAGYGGLELALNDTLGTDLAWVADNGPAPSRILAHNHPDTPNLGDVTRIRWGDVEPVDVLAGGFPCQDLSNAGLGAGLRPGTRSGLWVHMAYAIDALRPRLVVIENVLGLTWAEAHCEVESCPWCVGDGTTSPMRALGAVLGDLAELGFDAWWYCLRAPPATELGPVGNARLSPRFVEWLMCLPDGWVTAVPGLTNTAQLEALGNGVVPPQASAAIRAYLDEEPCDTKSPSTST